MKVSPLRKEILARSTIDKDNRTALPQERESCGWLLSSPLTTVFSRMHLSSPPRSQHFDVDYEIATEDVECRTPSLQLSSDGFPDKLSMSSYSSDDSGSWMMEDIFEKSQSNISYNKGHSSNGSSISQLADEEDIWRLWDTSKDTISSELLLYPVTSNSIQVREQGQLGTTRKLPSQLQFGNTGARNTTQLSRSSATRSPRRTTRAQADPPSPAVNTVYSPFPPAIPTIPNHHQEYHMKCHSWPAPSEPRVRPQRLRANTTPAPTIPTIRKVSRPSNLSTCTTLDQDYEFSTADTSKRLFIQSAPVSPQYPPFQERDLMDLMVETSAFSDDEEEEDDGPAFVSAMKSVLNLGRRSSNVDAEQLPVEKATQTSSKRTLRGALKSMLGKKKGATL